MPWIGPAIVGDSAAGGAEGQIYLVAKALAAAGHSVCVVTLSYPGLPPAAEGVDVLAYGSIGGGRRSALAVVRDFVTVRAALGRVEGRAFVQRSAGVHTAYVGLTSRLKGARFVYSSSSIMDFDFARVAQKRSRTWLFHFGLRLAQEVVVQTNEQRELFETRFGRSAVVIPNVAETADRRTTTPDAFLWIGNLARGKRIEKFVELARSVPEARFRAIVVPVESGQLERLTVSAKEVENLSLAGPRPRERVHEEISRAVAVVNTSDFEGMPNVFLEAWARGVPTLSLAYDPDGVIVRERLGGFALGSQQRLVELARAMWSDRSQAADQASRCQAYVRRVHAPDVVANQWAAALRLASA